MIFWENMTNKYSHKKIFFFGRQGLFLFLFLVVGYFLTRFYQLTVLPVFCDEAIYIRWSQIMRNEPSLRFLPLQDGKQPLFMWLTMPALKVFTDPLFAGRFVSILAGFATLLGIILLSFLVEVNWLFTALLYLLTPFSLFFDRMALVDSLLSAFGIWALNFSLLLARKTQLDLAMILGIILGGALLTKSPAVFFLFLSPLVITLDQLRPGKLTKKNLINVLKSLGLFLISLAFALTIYNVLRLGPNFHLIASRNKDYIYSFREIIQHPLEPFLRNAQSAWRYYWHYLTPLVFILGILGVLVNFRSGRFLSLLIWWLIPFFIQLAIAKTLTARYLLFSVPVFLIFVSEGIRSFQSRLKKRKWAFLFWLLILFPLIYLDYWLWHNPSQAPLPEDERKGYLQDWTAGWGIKSVADYLKRLPRDKNIVVGTEGFFGTLPEGLQIYLQGEPGITVIGVGYPIKEIPEPLINAKKAGDRVYLVVNQSRLKLEKQSQLKLIQAYKKPGGDKLLFFELKY